MITWTFNAVQQLSYADKLRLLKHVVQLCAAILGLGEFLCTLHPLQVMTSRGTELLICHFFAFLD